MSGLTDLALAVVVGGVLGIGLWSLLAVLPRWRAPALNKRIAPYLRDISDPLGITPPARNLADPLSAIVTSVRSAWEGIQRRGYVVWGSSSALARMLTQAGRSEDPARFRARQLGWSVVGLGAGACVSIIVALSGRGSVALILLPFVFAIAAAVLLQVELQWQAGRKRKQVAEELPTVLEFLALCLSAGEGLLASIRRAAAVGSGELGSRLASAVRRVDTGDSLADALTSMAREADVAALSRAVDQLVAATERGAPVASVLRDQAADARSEAKRTLLEQAGRKEIYMLLPLVFLVLPLSVLFAVFPGIFLLRVGFG